MATLNKAARLARLRIQALQLGIVKTKADKMNAKQLETAIDKAKKAAEKKAAGKKNAATKNGDGEHHEVEVSPEIVKAVKENVEKIVAPTENKTGTQGDGKDWPPFAPPPHIAAALNMPATETIEWLRGVQKQPPLTKASTVAVRLNEKYEDGFAVICGERIYTRQAMLRANEIFIFPIYSKNPIAILRNFEAAPITSPGQSSLQLAVDRCKFIQRKPPKQVALKRAQNTTPEYRITGAAAAVQAFLAHAKPDWIAKTNEHHVEGFVVAHAYLTEVEVDIARATEGVMIEKRKNIETGNSRAKQLTIRANSKNVAANTVFNFCLKIQNAHESLGIDELEVCYATFRTHNCVRLTLNCTLTSNMMQRIRMLLPENCSAFSDVPLSVWAPSAGGGKSKSVAPPRPSMPKVPVGKKTLRLAANYQPHPTTFALVAEALGGELVTVENSHFTTRPMACIIAFDKDADTDSITAEEFAIDEQGSWRAWTSGRAWV